MGNFNVEIVNDTPCAADVAASTGLVSPEDARQIFRALLDAGFIIAPFEPANAMFEAYMMALNNPPITRKTMLQNVGKARRRWKAMATAGFSIAMSRMKEGLAPVEGLEPSARSFGDCRSNP